MAIIISNNDANVALEIIIEISYIPIKAKKVKK